MPFVKNFCGFYNLSRSTLWHRGFIAYTNTRGGDSAARMHYGLARSEFACRLVHGDAAFQHIIRYAHNPIFNVLLLHIHKSPLTMFGL